MQGIRRLGAGLMLVASLTACVNVGFSTRTFGASNLDELRAEFAYNNAYSTGMATLHAQLQLFAPSGNNPGVCNVGGSKQGCFDADTKAIDALRQLASALEAVEVPPRFAIADVHIHAAIADNIRGLELRNQAIQNNDDAAWAQHKTVLEAAQQEFMQAYQEYPTDNRPLPAP